MEVLGLSQQQAAEIQSVELQKLDKELVEHQKDCFKAIYAYGKLTYGFGYVKVLQKRLNLVNKRLDMVISENEREEL